MNAKQLLSSFLVFCISASTFATDGNEHFRIRIETPETRIFLGSYIEKYKEFQTEYFPPIGSDIANYAVNILVSGIVDSSQSTLDRDIENLARSRFEGLDYSVFNGGAADIDDFLARTRDINTEMDRISDDLKARIPESRHAIVDNMINLASRKIDDYRFSYLANQVKTKNGNSDYINARLINEFSIKVGDTKKIDSIDKRIAGIEKDISALKEMAQSREQAEKLKEKQQALELAKYKKQQQFKQDLQSIHYIGNGIAAIVGINDPKAGQLIAATNSSIIQILSSVDALSSSTGMAAFGQYAIIATASIQLLQAWGVFGGKQKDGIGHALQAIAKQIQKLQERMDSRFDRIENQMYVNQKEILRQFATLHSSMNNLDTALRTTYNKVLEIEKRMKKDAIEDDLKKGIAYLEEKLDPIDYDCLNKNLTNVEFSSCVSRYSQFITFHSHTVYLTSLAGFQDWNKFVDWQINHYSNELGNSRKFPNLSVLDNVEAKLMSLAEKNKGIGTAQMPQFKSVLILLKSRRAETDTLVNSSHIDNTLAEINSNIDIIRNQTLKSLNAAVNGQKFVSYLNELESMRVEYENAITERLLEVKNLQRTDTLAENYKADIRLTIEALRKDIQVINTFLNLSKKKTWASLINDESIDFPVIVKPRTVTSSAMRSFIIPASKVQAMLGNIKLSKYSVLSNVSLDFEMTSYKKDSKLTSQNPLKEGFGHKVRSGSIGPLQLVDYSGYVHFALNATIAGFSSPEIPKSFQVLQLSDKGQNCIEGKRRGAWYKNTVDPYSANHIVSKGNFGHKEFKEGCGSLFESASNSELAKAVQLENTEYFKVLDSQLKTLLKNQIHKAVLDNMEKNGIADEYLILQNNLMKLKGLIYFKNRVKLGQDLDLFNNYVSIRSQNIEELVASQLEFIIDSGKGRVLSDMSMSLSKWESIAN